MPISRHMLGQLVYPLGEHSYLDLGRAGVLFTEPKFAYDFALCLLVQVNPLSPIYFSQHQLYCKLTDYSISASRCKSA
jgi:hypothetical protein